MRTTSQILIFLSVCNLLSPSVIHAGETSFTNGVREKVGQILPTGWQIGSTEFKRASWGGHFGKVEHFYILLHDTQAFRLGLRKMTGNTYADGWIIILPPDYAYPDSKTQKEYSQFFVASNRTCKVFLLPPGYAVTTWPTMKADLAKAFTEKTDANTRVQGSLTPRRDSTP
jgi:hypothetical protein